MTVHAILSASSSSRWLSCTPSARLEQEFKDQETTVAAEGTAAHALAEYKLRHFLEQKAKKPKSEFDGPEMEGYTDDYVSFVTETYETVKQSCKGALMLIEQHLDFSSYVPDGFGTGRLRHCSRWKAACN
jgi:pyocin large subunit-like protein